MRLTILLTCSCLLVAGCTTDTQDGEDPASEASLAYDGQDGGGDQEVASCSDGTATLTGLSTVDEGAVTVIVTDGSDQAVFMQTFDDQTDLDGEVIQGDGGQWTLQSDRSTGFDGGYSFALLCS